MKQPEGNNMTDNLTPLTLVAAEIRTSADELARRYDDDVVVNDAGLRCVAMERPCVLIAANAAGRPPR
jgi:hypothetical protein